MPYKSAYFRLYAKLFLICRTSRNRRKPANVKTESIEKTTQTYNFSFGNDKKRPKCGASRLQTGCGKKMDGV